MNIKETLEKLPASWEEVTIGTYINKLSDIVISESEDETFDGMDNTVKLLSALTGETVEDLEAIPMNDILVLSKKVDFMVNFPKTKNESKIKWKSASEITYNDFILFQQLRPEFFKNLPLIIPAFSKEKISPDEVLKMNVVDMMESFFFLNKQTKKSVNHMKASLRMKLLKMKVKERIIKIVSKKKLIKQTVKKEKIMDGIS